MAKAAATIFVALEAQTATLKKGFDEAKQSINQLDSNMSMHVAKGMAAFTAGLMAVQAAIAVVQKGLAMLTGQMNELDSQQKIADKIGMTADAVAALGHAAVLAGESADVVNDAMMRMTKSISEAAERGTGPASKAIQELGLSAERLNDLTTEKKLGAMADAMQGVTNSNDKMRLAMEIFGRQGHVFVNMLSQGSAGLNEMMNEADRLGLVLGDKRRDIEAANDAIATMKRAWNAVVAQIAIALAPVIEQLAEDFTEVVIIIGDVVRALSPLITALAKLVKISFELSGLGLLSRWLRSMKEEAPKSDIFSGGFGSAKETFDAAAAAAAEAAAKMAEEFAKRGESITESLRTPGEVWKDTVAELKQLASEGFITWDTYERGVAKASESIAKSLRTPQEVFQQTMAELNEMVEVGALSWGLYQRGVKRAVEEMSKGKELLDDWTTPAIGAVTRRSAAGFSAVQQAKREEADRDRKHKETIAWYARIEEAVRASSITLAPVKL